MAEQLPQQVGFVFVEQYYKALNAEPELLPRFYTEQDSSFSHGTEGAKHDPVIGQKAIQRAIEALNPAAGETFARLTQVDCQETENGGIVIQVIGYLRRQQQAEKKFVQTFVLSRMEERVYHIKNDIFRYLNDETEEAPAKAPVKQCREEVQEEALSAEEAPSAEAKPATEEAKVAPAAEPPAATPTAEVTHLTAAAAVVEATENVAPAPAANGGAWAQRAKASTGASASAGPSQPSQPSQARPAAKPQQRKQAQTPKASAAPEQTAENGGGRQNTKTFREGCAIYVSNLTAEITTEDLTKLFSAIGRLAQPNGVLINKPKSGANRPGRPAQFYAFVEFEEPETLQKCLQPENIDSFICRGVKLGVQERVVRKGREAGGGGRQGKSSKRPNWQQGSDDKGFVPARR